MADQLLVQYLLGLLSEEETERLDEQSVADDDVADRLRVAEHDLIDAYVSGALDPATREQFERVYLASPRRRDKVRFAESLRHVVDRANRAGSADRFVRVDVEQRDRPMRVDGIERVDGIASPAAADAMTPRADIARDPARQPSRDPGGTAAVAATPPTPRSDAEPPAGPGVAARRPAAGLLWGLAAAAVLLLVVGGLLFMQTTRLRQELTAAQTERAALESRANELERQLADQRSANDDAAKELARIRALLAEGTSRPGNTAPGAGTGGPSPTSSSAVLATALILTPQTRAAGPIPAIAIRPGATVVALDLLLESNDFPRYQVALRDPSSTNSVVWRSDRLAPTATQQGSLLWIVVPAPLLKAQHYTLELSGIRANGDPDPVSSYTFRAVLLR